MKYYAEMVKTGREPAQLKTAPELSMFETSLFNTFIDIMPYDPTIEGIYAHLERTVEPQFQYYYFKVISILFSVKSELDNRNRK